MFETKGDRPQWQVVYDRLAAAEIGDVVGDDELAALLPDAPAKSVTSAFWRAVVEVEIAHKRSFTRVRLVGYRMVQASEHVDLARRHHRRAGRQLRSAWRKAHSADRGLLSQQDRRRVDDIELNLAQQREITARLERRIQQETHERKSDVAMVSERVDQLTALLERHGITAPDPQAVS